MKPAPASRGSLGQFRVTRVQEEPPIYRHLIDLPDDVQSLWHDEIAAAPWFDPAKEHVIVFVTNTRLRLLGWNLVSIGTLNEAPFHPREVLRPVIVAAGHGFLLAHNHPSGDPSPSSADLTATRRLKEAAEFLQLAFHDHVILGQGRYHSLREAGVL